MEVGSQTEPMDRQDILNLLRQKSFELEKKTGVSCGDQDEIHSVEIIDGESPHFNSHNEDTTGAGLRKNSQAVGKQLSSKKSLKAGHPLEQPSLADMICDAVWSRKGSFHSPGPSRSSSKKSRLVRSQSFSKVRKENENLMRVIQHTSPNLNLTNTSNFSTPVPPPPLLIDDQDESSGNYNNNNNNNFGGSSLTRSVITVDPGPGPLPKVDSSLERDMGIRSMRNESESPTTNSSSFTFTTTNPAPIPLAPLDFDRDRDESGTLSSSLIADILLSSSSGDRKTKTRVDKPKNKFPVDNVMMQDAAVPLGNSETSINAETPYTEQIISDSDIDENEYDRVRTSIVLR